MTDSVAGGSPRSTKQDPGSLPSSVAYMRRRGGPRGPKLVLEPLEDSAHLPRQSEELRVGLLARVSLVTYSAAEGVAKGPRALWDRAGVPRGQCLPRESKQVRVGLLARVSLVAYSVAVGVAKGPRASQDCWMNTTLPRQSKVAHVGSLARVRAWGLTRCGRVGSACPVVTCSRRRARRLPGSCWSATSAAPAAAK